jgi:hypothetical protein
MPSEGSPWLPGLMSPGRPGQRLASALLSAEGWRTLLRIVILASTLSPSLHQSAHSLTCTASYATAEGERRLQAQAFTFSSLNPLVVRTKVPR